MVAKAATRNEWAHDCLFFLDRFTRSTYADQLRQFHWLLYGGFPPAALESRVRVYQGMSLEDRRQFRRNAARMIRVPRDGAVVPE